MADITKDKLEYMFSYNKETGELIRNFSDKGIKAGIVAGTINNCGYRVIFIKNKFYLAHRLIWLMFFGAMPPNEIDHINGIRHDNRIENLRSVSHSENTKNQTIRTNNKSGVTGVHLHKGTGKWRARIQVNGVFKSLGLFERLEDAKEARINAMEKYGFHKNHGKQI